MRKKLLIWSYCVGFLTISASGQENDFGLWTSAGLSKDFDKWEFGLDSELRTKNNASQLHRISFGLNAEYKFTKPFDIGVAYIFILYNDTRYSDYQPRQRYQLYIEASQKIKRFKFSIREKLQRTIKDERDRIDEYGFYDTYKVNPEWILRSKIKVEYNIRKSSITPSFSIEPYYALNNPDGNSISDIRYKIDLSYRVLKHHSIKLFGLLDDELNSENPKKSFACGFEYGFSF
jgi:hypothetical protein